MGLGLAIGSYKAPHALFIADTTGNVGIGTTTPTAGILNAAANSNSVVGFSVVGWNSTVNSGTGNGTDAIHATGGNGNIPADYGNGGVGGVFTGGLGHKIMSRGPPLSLKEEALAAVAAVMGL